MAIKVLNQLDLNSSKIVNVADPTAAQDAATKAYVDTIYGKAIQVDIIESSTTWYKPTGAQYLEIHLWGAGQGGQSGGLQISGTTINRSGGLGGDPGEYRVIRVPAIGVPSSVTVTIGSGGAGAARRTTDGLPVDGGFGGHTTFGSFTAALGGIGYDGGGGARGGAGGGIASNVPSNGGAGGGGAGALFFTFTGNTFSVSLITGTNNSTPGTAGTAGVPATAGGDASGPVTSQLSYGSGGGGGGASYSTTAVVTGGNGGNGAQPAGGGGGGGAAGNRTTAGSHRSGAGGNGANGAAIIITFF